MNAFQQIFDRQLAHFSEDKTKSYDWRIEQLDRMKQMLVENETKFHEAVGKDFKKTFAEQYFEVNSTLGTIAYTESQLRKWMEPQEAPVPQFLAAKRYKGMVYREPFGVTLVIGPFNGPLLLSLRPAVNAIAGGNPVILKTSNALPSTSSLLLELIPKYFEPESVVAISGNRDAITELLKLPFSFIFFTGSTKVGKIIMQAATENLTPVLLELGGQNPAIVDETVDVAEAAKKIIWGATAWGGQWCTSPGYAYVHESIADEFAEQCKKALLDMYGPDPENSPDYSRIISGKEVKRLASLVDPLKVIAGGDYNEETRYFAPTIIYPASWSDKIMEDEIFGPLLPILVYSDLKEAAKQIKKTPKPLSAYIFSENDSTIQYLINTLSFGGGAVNEVNVYLYIESMPFGGIGASGIGNYYGKYGFDALTHAKSILYSPGNQSIDHLFPPYTTEKVKALDNWFVY